MEVSRDLLRLCLPGLSLAELEDILDFLYLVENILDFVKWNISTIEPRVNYEFFLLYLPYMSIRSLMFQMC